MKFRELLEGVLSPEERFIIGAILRLPGWIKDDMKTLVHSKFGAVMLDNDNKISGVVEVELTDAGWYEVSKNIKSIFDKTAKKFGGDVTFKKDEELTYIEKDVKSK